MEVQSRSGLVIMLLGMMVVSACRSALAVYENFTVGGTEGWVHNPSLSYTKWASGNNFSLGDFLLFNFAKPEYNVIETHNETVYKSCDYLNGNGDYEVWGEAGTTTRVAIPLVVIGATYFFNGANDSKQCMEGMKFSINVTEGEGLPPSLATPPPVPLNGSTPQTSGSTDSNGSNSNNDMSGTPSVHDSKLSLVLPLLLPLCIVPFVFL